MAEGLPVVIGAIILYIIACIVWSFVRDAKDASVRRSEKEEKKQEFHKTTQTKAYKEIFRIVTPTLDSIVSDFNNMSDSDFHHKTIEKTYKVLYIDDKECRVGGKTIYSFYDNNECINGQFKNHLNEGIVQYIKDKKVSFSFSIDWEVGVGMQLTCQKPNPNYVPPKSL